MNKIQVRVSKKRKCFATLDWNEPDFAWILSFQQQSAEVEIEFTTKQLQALRKMLNELYVTEDKFERHFGQC